MAGNREIAVSFLTMAASGRIKEAYERYVSPDFRHHNQFFRGDRASLMEAMEESAAKTPNKSLQVKLAVADRDMVVTYSRLRRADPEEPGIAVVHILRFEGEKIVEMWDVGQKIERDSPNENGMF